jgi:uncharacterized membrane protein
MFVPHWWYPFPWFLFTFLIVLLLFRFLFFRRGWGWGGHWDRPLDAESMLKRRLASGQITEEEYHRLLQLIRS